MKTSHVLGFPLAAVKTQPKPKKPEKKPPHNTNTTNLPLHLSHLKASHNKVVITCIIKHICFKIVKPAKPNLIYCVIMLFYFTFPHVPFVFVKGDFSGPGRECSSSQGSESGKQNQTKCSNNSSIHWGSVLQLKPVSLKSLFGEPNGLEPNGRMEFLIINREFSASISH